MFAPALTSNCSREYDSLGRKMEDCRGYLIFLSSVLHLPFPSLPIPEEDSQGFLIC